MGMQVGKSGALLRGAPPVSERPGGRNASSVTKLRDEGLKRLDNTGTGLPRPVLSGVKMRHAEAPSAIRWVVHPDIDRLSQTNSKRFCCLVKIDREAGFGRKDSQTSQDRLFAGDREPS